MDGSTLCVLADIVARHSPEKNLNHTAIKGLSCIRIDNPDEHLPEVYNPCICLVVQGAKAITYGQEVYPCGTGDYMTIPVTMPIIGMVKKASPENPYLCLQMDIDLTMAGEIFLGGHVPQSGSKLEAKSLFVATMDDALADPLVRLAKLLDSPEDSGFLAPLYIREICYRLLKSEHGRHIAHLAMHEGSLQRIGMVISHINQNFRDSIRIGDLAEIAEMSVSGLHQWFKKITTLTPIQFQKQLRLIEARRLMMAESKSAAEAAYFVGYESPSQFSREYSRMFGISPGRDIEKYYKAENSA
ncbi:AraC family transcriptional regulator [Maridesulfovibrio bastinii]|uniref:AraC family transcriptional regulator n=1 Tax=Maridesulfovibrio bastinii TaxID=47157 RepID=UPI000422C741|nr:AraC family transcriptional regulator [Maridesulfovibrio bastinii]